MFELLFKYSRDVYTSGELLLAASGDWLRWLVAGLLLLLVLSSFGGARLRGLGPGRRIVLGALQVLAVLTVALLLLEPVLKLQSLRPGANSVAVLVDTSASMGFAAADAEMSRADQAQELASELMRALAAQTDVALFTFDASARRRDLFEAGQVLTADGSESRLTRSLEEVLTAFQGAPLAAVVVISDGADTDPRASLAEIGASGVPVHTVGVGATRLVAETLLEDVQLPVDAPVNSEVTATLEVRHAGGGRALLRVLDGGRLVAARAVVLPPEQPLVRTRVSFDSGRAGIRDLVFEVVPEGADELPDNNTVGRLLTVSERNRSVLYMEGEPRWEYKFLRRALAGDDVVTLKSYLKTTDRKSYRQGVSAPDELRDGFPPRQRLFDFDVVILGSLPATELNDAQHELLEAFVAERGGSLLVLAGRNSLADGGWETSPLADLLPVAMVEAGSFGSRTGRAVVTRDGALSPVTAIGADVDAWLTLPELGDYQRLGSPKPAATTLLEFENGHASTREPLLVLQPYGLGTVAVLATSSTWRWQTRTAETDTRHQRFWRQLVRQLAAEAQQAQELVVSTLGQTVSVRALLRTAGFEPLGLEEVEARITAPDGSVAPLLLSATSTPGEFLGQVGSAAPGVHKIDVSLSDGTVYTRFARVGGGNQESRAPLQNVALLRRLAELTGGSYWSPATATGIPETLTYSGAGIREQRLLPLWDMPALFLLLLLVKMSEWLLRRRWSRI